MGYQEIGRLIDKWTNDVKFREEMRKNPEEAARKMGVQLTAEEWKAFKNVNWKASDQELKNQISKIPL